MSDTSFFNPLLDTNDPSTFPSKYNPDLGAARLRQVVTKSADYTAADTDDVILVDLSGGSVTISLDVSTTGIDSLNGAHVFTVKVSVAGSGNTCTVQDIGSGVTIDGGASVTLTDTGDSVTVINDGSNWFVIGETT